MAPPLRLAVITGGHPFPVTPFRDLLERLPAVDVYLQDLDNFALSRDPYDACLFYNMHYWGRLSVRTDMDQPIANALDRLADAESGVFVWHHALLSFHDTPASDAWSAITGLTNRRLRGCALADIHTHVALDDHPITHGLADFTLADEFFKLDEPGEGSQVLLTTEHPQSTRALAWTRQHGRARVFCYQSGHAESAYDAPAFQTVLARGIAWVGRRL
jgi:type 1 glutamine amidotransferase